MTALTIAQSISVIVASLAASAAVIHGVTTWRREYIGKKRLDLAEEVLALFYEATDAIADIRSPFGYEGEGTTRKSTPNETPEEKSINDRAYVTIERYAKRHDLFSRLHSLRYRYMAQFGKDSAKPFDDLAAIIRDILATSRVIPHYWRQQGLRQWNDPEEFQRHLQQLRKFEQIIWYMGPERDIIVPRLEQVIAQIEAQSAKIIGKSK